MHLSITVMLSSLSRYAFNIYPEGNSKQLWYSSSLDGLIKEHSFNVGQSLMAKIHYDTDNMTLKPDLQKNGTHYHQWAFYDINKATDNLRVQARVQLLDNWRQVTVSICLRYRFTKTIHIQFVR